MTEPTGPRESRDKTEGKIPRPEQIDQGDIPILETDPSIAGSVQDLLERARQGADNEAASIDAQVDALLTEDNGGETTVEEVPLPPSKAILKNPLGEPWQASQDIDDVFAKKFKLE